VIEFLFLAYLCFYIMLYVYMTHLAKKGNAFADGFANWPKYAIEKIKGKRDV